VRKSSVFLSVALTAFVVSILAGIIYAYNGLTFTEPFSSTQVATQDQATIQVPPTASSTQSIVSVSPQDAAAIAAKFLKRTDLYSVQLATINGLQLYKVAFVSGDAVYVSLDGQVVLSVPAPQPSPTPVVIIISVPGNSPHGSRGGGGSGGSDGGGGDG
jgi:uncharacterized membrane protein YgcG